MGCGISKFENINAEEGTASPCYLLSPIHPRTDRAVADSSLFSKPLMSAEDQHAKGYDIQHNKNMKKVNSERDQQASDKEGNTEDEEEGNDRGRGIEYPRSLSFRIYISKADVEVEPIYDQQHLCPTGHTNSEHIKDEQQGESDIENSKKV